MDRSTMWSTSVWEDHESFTATLVGIQKSRMYKETCTVEAMSFTKGTRLASDHCYLCQQG